MYPRRTLLVFCILLAPTAAGAEPGGRWAAPTSLTAGPTADGRAAGPQGRLPEVRLDPSDDSGASRTDGLTNVNKPRLEGRAKPGSTVVIVQKRYSIASVKVPDSGRFQVRLPRLPDGRYEFSAVELVTEDTGYFSPPVRLEIDATPPPEPKFTMLTDVILMDRLASFAGRASEDTARAELMLGKRRMETAYAVHEKFRFTKVRLAPGHRQLHVRLTDWAGNQMESKPIDVYVVQARDGELLKRLDGSKGFRLRHGTPRSLTGFSLSSAGDVNGDGISDIVIGAPADHDGSSEHRGLAYVKFGSRDPFSRYVSLSKMAASDGFAIQRESESFIFGYSVSAVGDINSDGVDDFAIGDPLFGNPKNPSGAVYVVFGTKVGLDGPLKIDELDGLLGFKLVGRPGDNIGGSISGGHDFNGDGVDDFVVGAGSGAGKQASSRPVYIVYGQQTAFPATVALDSLTASEGIRVNGRGSAFGYSVALGRDVSGDGRADIVISEPSPGDGRTTSNRGAIHILFGRKDNAQRLSVPFKPEDGVSMTGRFSNQLFEGFRIGAATSGHDVNGDGLGDVVVSTSFNRGQKRTTGGFVIFGSRRIGSEKIDLGNLNGKDGFRVEYTRDKPELRTVYDVIGDDVLCGIDDANGDGIDDILISTNGSWQTRAAETFVLYGSEKSFPSVLYIDTLDEGAGRTMRDQMGYVGFSAAGAGDLNGDGIGDILIGAPMASSTGFPEGGEVYVVFGSRRAKGQHQQ